MEALVLALSALALAGILTFVARPLLRGPGRGHDPGARDAALRLAAFERRDRALAALKELEFDQRTGKVGELDYHALLAVLRAEAADALREIVAAEALDAAASVGARPARPRRAPPVGARGSRG